MTRTIDDELAEQLNLLGDTEDIPSAIVDAVEYIRDNTGLLGDYNTGFIQFAEGGSVVQWYARDRYMSSHDDLLQWVQLHHDDLCLGVVGTRQHPDTGETVAYAEIHESSRWRDDQ